jgi:hypothetical protein
MAYEEALKNITFEAGQDLSAKQYFFVTKAADDGQIDPTGDGALANGVLQNNPSAAGMAATVAIDGITKLSAGAAFSRGAILSSDANGEAITIGSGDYPLARALEAATAAHDIVSAQLMITGVAKN